jgi:hypothetical protein
MRHWTLVSTLACILLAGLAIAGCGGTSPGPGATATPTSTPPTLSDGDVFQYLVTCGSDVTTYTMTVNGSEVIDNVDCYRIDVDMEPPAQRTTIGGNTTVISGDMWVSKDTLLLMRKLPVALVQHPTYGEITAVTTINYSYTISAGWPWQVGRDWAYIADVNSTTGQHYVLNNSVEIPAIEDISVPAGNFSCYRLEHSNQQGNITLIEWWSDDLGLFVKMLDYGNYVEPETRELQSYPGSE